jgi:hypothetical protein
MKTGRRDFLAAASLAAASARVLWPVRAMAQSGEPAARANSLTIVFDERLADSRAFAFRSRTMGARVVPLRDDIGVLWFQRLMPLAASPCNTIAGLTRHADAFLLTCFAQSSGMRATQRTAGAHARADTLVMWRLDR